VVRNTDLQRFVTRVLASADPLEDDVVLHGDREGVLQARGAALHDARGRGIGAVIVLNDVTDFRQLEHIRRDFVANVSHELKTPVTAIKGFVETLLDGAIHTPDDAERFLRIVAKQADRLNAIIEDLLSLSKIEEGEEAKDIVLERSDVGEVLESAVHNCEPIASDRQVRVNLSHEPDLVASFNAPLLEQAVINLLDNAIKYSEPGATVDVRGSRTREEVTISVIDYGAGIAAEHFIADG
jgi:two-component system phosphate regulon sensor histidine kinase PhoR